jgi:uncharacterized iron-regulated membrane protein
MGGVVSARKALFWGHLALGVAAGLVVLSMAVTGVILAFEPQIVALSERRGRMAAPPVPGAVRRGLGALVEKALAARPGGKPSAATVKADPAASVAIQFGPEDSLFLDPYTGAVSGGTSKTHRFLHAVEEWHRWLAKKEVGRPVTGAACAAFFFLMSSGFILWWPRSRTRSAFKSSLLFNPALSGKARDWNRHNVIGFWNAPLVLLTTFTGLVVAYPWANDLLFKAAGDQPPPRRVETKRSPAVAAAGPAGPPLPAAGLDALLAVAQSKAAGWTSITLRLPRRPEDAVTAFIEEPSSWGPALRSQLTLDPLTAQEVEWEPAAGQGRGKRWRAWMVPLHTGRAWGAGGQALMGLASAGAAMLVWTGLAMAWRRFRS